MELSKPFRGFFRVFFRVFITISITIFDWVVSVLCRGFYYFCKI